MSETIEYKCPCCGGTLQFDVESQRIKCPYCDSEFDVDEMMKTEGDLTVNDDLATDGGVDWDAGEMEGMSEYQCQSCGGNLYSDKDTTATICPYCGSSVILKGRLSGVLKPDKVLPFKQTKDDAIASLQRFIDKKHFVSKRFLQENHLEENKGLYVPFWVYDADIHADIEFQGVDEERWSSGDTEYIERRYYRVERGGDIGFDHVPADGSSKIADDLMESIEPFDHSEAMDFTTAYLSGYVADKYDLDQEAVRPRVKNRIQESTVGAFRSTVHYDEVYTKSADVRTVKSSVEYVLYPVWLMSTRWNDSTFTFAMNGQTGKMVGNLPADKLRFGLATGGIFLLISVLFAFLFSMFADGFGLIPVLIGVLIGAIVAGLFFRYFYSQLKNVKPEHDADNYYRSGSMHLNVERDIYLYKRVTRRKIKN